MTEDVAHHWGPDEAGDKGAKAGEDDKRVTQKATRICREGRHSEGSRICCGVGWRRQGVKEKAGGVKSLCGTNGYQSVTSNS